MNDRSIVETSSPYGNDVHFPLNEYETAPNTPLIDTAWIRGALYRQRWLIAACIGAGLLIGLVLTLLTTPIYQASATARIAPWGYFIVEGQDVSSPVNSANEIDGFLSTLGAVVKSRNLAEVVAEGLPEGTANALLPEDFDENRPAELNDEQWEAQRQNRVVDTLMAGVGAQVPRINRIMTLTFDSPDPVLAMDVANAYAVAFSQSDTRRSIVSNTYAREYLLGEIEDVRERLAQSERATNAYARDAGIVTPQTTGGGGEGGQTITGANLSSLNQNLGAAKAKRIAAEQRWRTIENTPAAELPFVQNNSVVQNLVSNRAQLEGELTNLKRRYNDSFPEIVDINARIDLLNQQIEEVGNNLKAGVRSEFVIAQNEEAALQAELYAATDNALDEQEQKIEFTGLESEAVALRGRLNQLLDRYNQLSTASNVQSGAITILDRAVLPQSPIAPNFLQNMIFALLIGTVLAGGLAIAREIFVDQFRRLEDVRDRLNLPVLGVTPFVKEDELEEEEAN
ncbi:MAG: GumC family protein, partial [Pseudomonadota bacterium]